jgi:hypothetical protein
MNTVQYVLNTAASAAIANRQITFPSASPAGPVIKFLDSKYPVKKTVYSAEVLGQATVSWTVANNTTYSFVVKQKIGAQESIVPFSYTSDATATEAEIDAAITAVFTQLIASGVLKIAAVNVSGTNTAVFTALAGYPELTVIAGQNTTVGSVTVGKKAVNAGADLVAAGVPNAEAGSTYTSYEFTTADFTMSAGQERDVWKKLVLYVKTGEDAIGDLDAILDADAFDSGQIELNVS